MRNFGSPAAGLFAFTIALAPAALAQPYGQQLAPSVVRWHDSKESADAAPPSHALVTQPKDTPQAEDAAVKPEFGKAASRSTARVHVESGSSLYGAGRARAPLLRRRLTD